MKDKVEYKDSYKNNQDDFYELNIEQIKAIEKGLEDIKNGNVLSNEEANKEIEKWLSNNCTK